jgi:glycosyltransferase involved in cell wall biosynthesis
MRIGVYIGSWPLSRFGGMGTYVRELLGGLRRLDDPGVEAVLLVDRSNRAAARELDPEAPIILMDRVPWTQVPRHERRRAIAVRSLSYRAPDVADARRGESWSPAAEAYLWGLDDACIHSTIDVLYFPIPPYIKRPRVPSVVTIHDLKHVHRPQDHDIRDRARRRRWGRLARAAQAVFSSYEHVRRDVIMHLKVRPDAARVIPVAAPDGLQQATTDPRGIVSGRLPSRFGLFPGQFWPHKNHAMVLLALHHLRRDRNMGVPIVCTGQTTGECSAYFEQMRALSRQLRVDDLLLPTGHVDPREMRALYAAASFVLAPTLYDPGSFPAMEALALGKPLIASNVTSLPELVGDAGLLFDPHSVDELVEAMARLWTDPALCDELSRRGPARIPRRSWTDVARDWLRLCAEATRAELTSAAV